MHPARVSLPRTFVLGALVSAIAGCSSLPGASSVPADKPLTLTGELTSRSPVNVNNGARYQSFPIQLNAGDVVEVRQQSSLSSQLSLLDGQQQLVNGPGSNALTLAPTQSGRYLLSLSGDSAAQYGPFALTLNKVDVRNGGPIGSGERLAGLLSSTDGNHYQLQVGEAAIYRISMSSEVLDTTLNLEGQGIELENDDSGDGTNSRIDAYLEPGSYAIKAGALDDKPNGTYLIGIEQRALPAGVTLQGGGLLEANKRITGLASAAELSYRLRLDEPALVTLRMSSSEIDTQLGLSGHGVEVSDDDGAGEGTNSLISQMLEPGEYKVVASSIDSSTGLFTLEYQQQPVSRGELSSLRPGQYANGTLRSSGPSSARLHIREAGQYQLDLVSSDFDGILRIDGDDVEMEDDDSGGARNARMSLHLDPGVYSLQIRGVESPSRGRFRVSVQHLE